MIAEQFLRGAGIEIGALHQPLEVPSTASVRYVDRMSLADLTNQYPDLKTADLVDVDVVDDGEQLTTFLDASLDFVIANHFIEHCADPVGTIENFLRVVKPGGIIYLAIPDMRFTFDRDRNPTSKEHLLRDYREGPQWSRNDHFSEWVRLVDKVQGEEAIQQAIQRSLEMDYSIHFHCWTQAGMMELMAMLKEELRFRFDVDLFFKNGIECIFVLRKSDEH